MFKFVYDLLTVLIAADVEIEYCDELRMVLSLKQ